ncbi:class I SAM-dependent methyltransferase [Streptomyces sp. AP-93]|uniref:class I SAM-dependent methyltransferase n=1 Tax=Streptomyces sp. AP-93 TaxID=2929048 RepID=UPI001FAFEB52|nr:methyltransferase [Streptomyces sp. AP-93]MCJ0872599.1 methyltransferase domain-containing protein [Streptomyces sp. AP-93]
MDNWTTSHDRVLAQRDAEGWTFLIEALRDFHTTGAVLPSSRRLAALLTDPVREHGSRPLNVLEAGAGTGAVTRALIPLLSNGSRLDVVEANPRFAAHLRQLVHTRPWPEAGVRQAQVHEALVEEVGTGHRYDVIVSGLPLTNFTPARVETVMDRYLELLRPGGTLTYFSYLATGPARRLLASRAASSRHRAVEQVLDGYQRRHATGRWTVWGNLPPARVWHLRAPQPATALATEPAPTRVHR